MKQCRRDIYPVYTIFISGQTMPDHIGYRPKLPPEVIDVLKISFLPQKAPNAVTTQLTQTSFRDSEAQTDPYGPELREPVDRKLEIFTLGWLCWNNGLPAGFREALIIERARQKRAWENALPPPVDATAKNIRDTVIEAIEINEWKYREIQIDALSSIRTQIVEDFVEKIKLENKEKCENYVAKYATSRSEERNEALRKVRAATNRSMRMLVRKRDNVRRKYHRSNIVDEIADKSSEWYGPQERFGENPCRRHEVILPEFRFWNVFSHMELMHRQIKTFRSNVTKFDFVNKSKPVNTERTLCEKETGLAAHRLYEICVTLRSLRKSRSKRKTTGPPKFRHKSEPAEVPFVPERVAEEPDDELYQICLYLQKTIKGRAIQTVMFEGRAKCQELIDELKSSHAIHAYLESATKMRQVESSRGQQRKEIQAYEQKRKKEVLDALEGKTVSETLDFLAKELLRLENEKIIHAAALMADRERHRREAAEAGRRQTEEQRLREHNEMLKQIYKTYQNSATMIHGSYIHNGQFISRDTLAEAVAPLYAKKVARNLAEDYARKIDRAADEAQKNSDSFQEAEIVADLIHNFALPEAQKVTARERLAGRQQALLSACHDEIYSKIESLVLLKRSASGRLMPLKRPQKHCKPNFSRVVLFKLAAVSVSSSGNGTGNNAASISTTTSGADYEKDDGDLIASRNAEWSSSFSRQEILIE